MVSLAVTYFRTGNPHYHRRDVVSRPCSGWEGVGPTRYGRQAIRGSGPETKHWAWGLGGDAFGRSKGWGRIASRLSP